jgi:hypothetical protein
MMKSILYINIASMDITTTVNYGEQHDAQLQLQIVIMLPDPTLLSDVMQNSPLLFIPNTRLTINIQMMIIFYCQRCHSTSADVHIEQSFQCESCRTLRTETLLENATCGG